MFEVWIILPVVISSCQDALGISTTMSTNQCGNVTCNKGSPCVNQVCRCMQGYTGDTCHEDLDECQHGDLPCFYRGYCHNTVGSYWCACLQGWVQSGHCETPISLADENRSCVTGHFGSWCNYTCFNDSMCGPNSHCENLGSGRGQACRCNRPGWHGVHPHCLDVDECAKSDVCDHNGTCANIPGSFLCSCTRGWMGELCKDIDQCASSPCINWATCQNSGAGSFKCHCAVGWNGTLCELDINECKLYPNHCKHLGRCENVPGSFLCNCTDGWTGDLCDQDVNECARSHVCDHNGTCVNTPGSFRCFCTRGWMGELCKAVDQCASTPCNNSSTCKSSGSGLFECHCAVGWNGTLCELDINECKLYPNHCKHLGRCENVPGSFLCNCADGWTGDQCDQDVNECDRKPCNDAYCCINTPGSYNCSLAACSDEKKASAVNIGVIVGTTCAVLGLASIITAVLLARYCWKRQRALKTSRNQVTDEAKDTMRN